MKAWRSGLVGASLGLLLIGGALAAAAVQASFAAPDPVRVVDEVAVTPTLLESEFSSNSPLLMADPEQPRFVVMANRLDAPDFSCALQVSGDTGRTWMTANPVPELPTGAEKCYAAEVAFGSDGTLYYLFVVLAGTGNRPMGSFLVTSRDRAQSFSAPRQVLGPLTFGVRMAIDPHRGTAGRVHLVWITTTSGPSLGGFGPPPNPIMSAYSDDGGQTFSKPVQVSDPGRERVVAPAVAVGPDSAVHVAYYDLGRDALDYQGLEGPVWGEPWLLLMSSSLDGGQNFTRHGVVDADILPSERVMLIFTMAPAALVAGQDGLLCTAWTDARHGDADVLGRCSYDRAQSWEDLRRLNDNTLGDGTSQYLPRLALSPGGRLDAVFFDRRQDPHNVLNHVSLTFSTDGGRHFAANHRISGEPSDSRIGQQYVHAAAKGQHEIGARLALLSQPSYALAAWPDSRHWGRGTTGQDLFAVTVALPQADGRSWRAGLAVVLLLGGVVAVAAGRRHRRNGRPMRP